MKAQHGMTLVEALVALVLLSMLSVGLFSTFSFGQRTYSQMVTHNGDSSELFAAQRFLRQIVESGYPAPSAATQGGFALWGSATEIALTAPAPGYGASGLMFYRIAARSSKTGSKDLIAYYRVGGNAMEDLAAPSAAGLFSGEEVLVQNIRDVEFSYMPFMKSGAAAGAGMQWMDSWQSRDQLPALIRVRVSFSENDRRRWTEMIAAPRITDDAQCEFDIVAQGCRQVSK